MLSTHLFYIAASPVCVSPLLSHTAVLCPWLEHPVNGRVKQGRPPTFGCVANYSCRPGYGIVGDAQRTCQANSSWSGSPPFCTSEHTCI